MADALARHAPAIRLLRGEVFRLPTQEPLYLAGVDDPGRNWFSNPLELEQLERIGQSLPRGRINLARLVTRFHRGLYRERDSVMYVNRGIGVAGPAIRFNCSREIATIELS